MVFKKGHKHSEEIKEKIRLALKGKPKSIIANKKSSNTLKKKYASGELIPSWKGKHHTEESKRKIVANRRSYVGKENPMYGKKRIRIRTHLKIKHHTSETKRKISDALKGKHNNPKAEFKKGHKSSTKGKSIKIIRICRYCNNKFLCYPKSNSAWCCRKCYKLDEKPNYITEEGRIKISIAKSGRKRPDLAKRNKEEKYKLKGKNNPAKRPEVRAKISKNLMGNLHPNWKGGITPINERIRCSAKYKEWRNSVFERDNWTCQKCKLRGSITLNAHHIKSFAEYPSLRFDINNGVTLCKECHNNNGESGKRISNRLNKGVDNMAKGVPKKDGSGQGSRKNKNRSGCNPPRKTGRGR